MDFDYKLTGSDGGNSHAIARDVASRRAIKTWGWVMLGFLKLKINTSDWFLSCTHDDMRGELMLTDKLIHYIRDLGN